MFVRGVDVDISLRDTFEQRLNEPFNISMILNFILEKLMELLTTLGQRNGSHICK